MKIIDLALFFGINRFSIVPCPKCLLILLNITTLTSFPCEDCKYVHYANMFIFI
ncbi:hypothetical protein ZIOFF_036943 [Zingiber officinale]|uniref:Uncharacterized protein n=1 Tax=Zingiber officinale TaxID=94328 RepID=A0A8J5L321_ZINOF|nr:hypothetical protein ZIOFF_036943 [Zingiber officinale]